MKYIKEYNELFLEEANMSLNTTDKVSKNKNEFLASHAVGDIVAFIPENNGNRIPAIIRSVEFTPQKVRYSIITFEGGEFDSIYSQRIDKANESELSQVKMEKVLNMRKLIRGEANKG